MNKGLNFKFKTYVFTIALNIYGKFKLSHLSGTKHAQIFLIIWMFCKLHGILDKINKEKYDLPMQMTSLYLAVFAKFGHQSMHQVLQGTLINKTLFFRFSSETRKEILKGYDFSVQPLVL